jgi:hypothetical protein
MHSKLEELPSPWPSFLKEIDESLIAPVELHCLGGFVLAALYGLPRPTGDVDYIAVIPRDAFAEIDKLAGLQSKLCKKHKLYLQHVGIYDLPDGYEGRLTELHFGFTKLSLKVLEPYDLALSKLTRNNAKDREDVKLLAARQKLSFKTVMERFEVEMKPWLPNLERHLLTLKLWEEYFPKEFLDTNR